MEVDKFMFRRFFKIVKFFQRKYKYIEDRAYNFYYPPDDENLRKVNKSTDSCLKLETHHFESPVLSQCPTMGLPYIFTLTQLVIMNQNIYLLNK